MSTIDITNISNAKLKTLAKVVDESKISTKDNKIDDKEFNIFKQRAKIELLDKKLITEDDYTKIFGLVKTNVEKKDNAYKNYKNSEIQKEEKEQEIERLKKDINNIREKLYKGRYSNIMQKQKGLTKSQKDAAVAISSGGTAMMLGVNFFGGVALGVSSIEALGISTAAASSVAGVLGAGAATLTAGVVGGAIGIALPGLLVAGGCYLYNKYTKDDDLKFIQQCQQENPELYNALMQAEKRLAELQK